MDFLEFSNIINFVIDDDPEIGIGVMFGDFFF
jgi:hypothetical protein